MSVSQKANSATASAYKVGRAAEAAPETSKKNTAQFSMDALLKWRLLGFIALCWVLGGTSQNIVAPKVPLYLLSACMISYIWWYIGLFKLLGQTKYISVLFGSFIVVSLLQLIPLPPSLWEALPNRQWVIDGFNAAGLKSGEIWMPLSLTPEMGWSSLLNFLPPIAIYLMVIGLSSREEREVCFLGIMVIAAISTLIGVLQVLVPNDALHPYAVTNSGLPVGLFSNANHQATLMVIGLALAIGNLSRSDLSNKVMAFSALVVCILVAGLLTNSSVAGYLLMVVVAALSVVLLFGKKGGARLYLIGGVGVLLVALLTVYDYSSGGGIVAVLMTKLSTVGQMSRGHVFQQSWQIATEFMPLGTGLGSFPTIFPFYEDMAPLNNIFLPHVHNDYIEILIEFGLLGALWILALGVWLAKRFTTFTFSKTLKKSRRGRTVAMACLITMIAVSIHSLVDYPLRTITIATVFAFCLGVVERYVQEI